MASVNRVIILGNLGRDPEIRNLASGDAVANLAIATSFKMKDKNTGEAVEKTEWHRVSLFGRMAELAGQYLAKGSSVYIEGRLQTRKYQKDGVDHYATEIVGENMQFVGGKPDGQQTAPAPQQNREQARDRQHAVSRQAPAPAHSSDGFDDRIPF